MRCRDTHDTSTHLGEIADDRRSSNNTRQVDDFEAKQRSDVGGMSGYVGPPAGALCGTRIVMHFVQANVGVGLRVVRCAKFVDGITDGTSLAVFVIHEGV